MKVLAFFGSDLDPVTGPDFLKKSHRDGYALLALDSGAMAAATGAGVGYSLIEDWLEPEILCELIATAEECERTWYELAREDFTVDGVCWPEIDQVAMRRFWQDALIASAFATEFQKRGGRELKFFGDSYPRPATFSVPSSVCAELWKSMLKDKTSEMKRRTRMPTGFWRQFGKKAFVRLVRLLGSRSIPSQPKIGGSCNEGSVVLVLGELEALRFKHIMQDLAQYYPEKAAAVASGPYTDTARQMASVIGVPVAAGPTWPFSPDMGALNRVLARLPIDLRLQRRFLKAYRRLAALPKSFPWSEVIHRVPFHFEYYCWHRWPVLHTKTLAFWRNLWTALRPAAVIATTVWGSYYLSACLAAKRLNIATFMLGHGAIQLLPRNLSKIFVTDYVLYEGRLQKTLYERAGVSSQQLVPCKGIIAKREYPVSSQVNRLSDQKWRILVLLGPTNDGQHLAPLISLRAQSEGLKALASPPQGLSGRLDLVLKTHPYYQDREIIKAACPELMSKVVGSDADLHGLIRQADLVVALNYSGSALVHVFRAGKPVIYLLTELECFQNRSDAHFDLFIPGCALVRSGDSLWRTIRDFFTIPEMAETMRSSSEQFSIMNFDSSDVPGLAQALGEKLRIRRVSKAY